MPGRSLLVSRNGSAHPDHDAVFTTIPAALAYAQAGDTIRIEAGEYRPFEIEKSGSVDAPIRIESLSGEPDVVIDGQNATGNALIGISGQSHVSVSGFHLQNAPNFGIYVEGSDSVSRGITLENNLVDTTGNSGIHVNGVDTAGLAAVDTYYLRNIIIRNNEVTNTNTPDGVNEAIAVGAGVDGFVIANNYVHSTDQYGIDVKAGARNGRITDNTIHDVELHGIYIDAGSRTVSNIVVNGNDIRDAKSGIVIARESRRDPENPNLFDIDVFDNRISNVEEFGVLLYRHVDDSGAGAIERVSIRANIIDGAGSDGVRVANIAHFSDDISITGNVISNSARAIWENSYVLVGNNQTGGLEVKRVEPTDQTDLWTRNGHDVVVGTSGNDRLWSLSGDDIIRGLQGSDTINSGEGNDLIYAGDGDDFVIAAHGDDTVWAGSGRDTVRGYAGDDLVYGGGDADTIILGSGDDRAYGEFGNDTIEGGDGHDRIWGGMGADRLEGGGGNDVIDGGLGDDSILGGSGADEISGDDGRDLIYGGAGHDVVRAGDGNDEIHGGDGDDVILGGEGNDRLDGEAGSDELSGEAGNDAIWGGDGDDIIHGQDGDDTLGGGAGNDTISGDAGQDVVNAGTGRDVVDGGIGNDILRGDADDDILRGAAGIDTLNGGTGDDALHGGSGADTLTGSFGSDRLFGDSGNDVLEGNSEDDLLRGGDGDDILRGGADNDVLFGDNGTDLLFGTGGRDTLNGGAGGDVLDGGGDNDILRGEAGNDVLRAGDGRDNLLGGTGNDTLVGGTGDDLLEGGLGQDLLRGQTGDDVFIFRSAATSVPGAVDLIDGMDGIGRAGGDRIDLSDIDANTVRAGQDNFVFLGEMATSAGLAQGAGALWLENDSGMTMLFGLTNWDNQIDFAVMIRDGTNISASDYIAGDFLL